MSLIDEQKNYLWSEFVEPMRSPLEFFCKYFGIPVRNHNDTEHQGLT